MTRNSYGIYNLYRIIPVKPENCKVSRGRDPFPQEKKVPEDW